MTEFYDNWTKQVRKGIIEYCILATLENDELYGYALVKTITSLPGLQVAEGTIYPLLSRLKKQNLLSSRLQESHEGPARKYYLLTTDGEKQLALMHRYFDGMLKGIDQIESIKSQLDLSSTSTFSSNPPSKSATKKTK